MNEQLRINLAETADVALTSQNLGRITILEALAIESDLISIDGMGRCTPDGTGVDFDD
ncbi:MAG: hypothetical protein NTX11_04590 [Candidatus Saccharibacteria bacterium]|nr:hypothetical protein [Candidatus Saccharibacteria bacterium]